VKKAFILLALTLLSFCQPYNRLEIKEDTTQPHIMLVVVDGVRYQEFFKEDYYPYVKKHADIMLGGATNCFTNNRKNCSLPAYADIMAGADQNVVNNSFNGDLEHYTIADALPYNQVAVISYWYKLKRIVSKYKVFPPFYQVTDKEYDHHARYDDKVYEYATKYHGRFNLLMFADTDSYAHSAKVRPWKMYTSAIKLQDGYIEKLHKLYPNDIFIITTDHGRGAGRWWRRHVDRRDAKYVWVAVIAPQKYLFHFRDLRKKCDHITLGRTIHSILLGD